MRRRGDEVAVLDRVRVQARRHQTREMRHVAEEERVDLVGDLPELVGLDGPRVGGAAADDQLRLVLPSEVEHIVVVDHVRLAAHAVVGDRVQPAREVDLQAVRQVAAVRELEREDRVARLQRGHVDGHVRLGARVRLDVRVLGSEQRLRAVDRRLLDLVDDVAAAVVALARVALGVLVRRHRADGFEDARPREVLGRDQLDLAALALELLAEELRDLGVDLGEPGGAQLLERLVRDGHHRHGTHQASRAPRTSAAGTAPSRRIRGSGPVRSTTVEGVPGSSPPSTRRGLGSDLLGNLVEPAGIGAAVEVRARRGDRADPRDDPLRGAAELRDAHADRVRTRPGEKREALLRVREDQRQRPGRRRAHARPRAARARARAGCRPARRGARSADRARAASAGQSDSGASGLEQRP